MRAHIPVLLCCPLLLTGCPVVAALGFVAALDSDPDKWVQWNMVKKGGEWNATVFQMSDHQGDVDGPILEEVVLDGQTTVFFTSDESIPHEGAGWDEREGIWTLPDGPVDFHWDADSNGTEDTLIFSIAPHGTIGLWDEQELPPFWSQVAVIDEDEIHLIFEGPSVNGWMSGRFELVRID